MNIVRIIGFVGIFLILMLGMGQSGALLAYSWAWYSILLHLICTVIGVFRAMKKKDMPGMAVGGEVLAFILWIVPLGITYFAVGVVPVQRYMGIHDEHMVEFERLYDREAYGDAAAHLERFLGEEVNVRMVVEAKGGEWGRKVADLKKKAKETRTLHESIVQYEEEKRQKLRKGLYDAGGQWVSKDNYIKYITSHCKSVEVRTIYNDNVMEHIKKRPDFQRLTEAMPKVRHPDVVIDMRFIPDEGVGEFAYAQQRFRPDGPLKMDGDIEMYAKQYRGIVLYRNKVRAVTPPGVIPAGGMDRQPVIEATAIATADKMLPAGFFDNILAMLSKAPGGG